MQTPLNDTSAVKLRPTLNESVSRERSGKQKFIFSSENQSLEEYIPTIAGCRANFRCKELCRCSEVAGIRLILDGAEKVQRKILKLFSAPSDTSDDGGSTAAKQHRTSQS